MRAWWKTGARIKGISILLPGGLGVKNLPAMQEMYQMRVQLGTHRYTHIHTQTTSTKRHTPTQTGPSREIPTHTDPPPKTHPFPHTDTHSHTDPFHKERHTHIQTRPQYTETPLQRDTYTDPPPATDTHRHTERHAQKHTHRPTYTRSHTNRPTYTCSQVGHPSSLLLEPCPLPGGETQLSKGSVTPTSIMLLGVKQYQAPRAQHRQR